MIPRLRYALAAAMLAIAPLPALGGCANLIGGCPITDDGVDDCPEGETECVDDTTVRTCNSGGPCDSYWIEDKCMTGQHCTVVEFVAACR